MRGEGVALTPPTPHTSLKKIRNDVPDAFHILEETLFIWYFAFNQIKILIVVVVVVTLQFKGSSSCSCCCWRPSIQKDCGNIWTNGAIH
jgi:hypothetical protein